MRKCISLISKKPWFRTSNGRGLSGIAPDHLSDTYERNNRSIGHPPSIAHHESNAEGKVEPLQDPDGSHGEQEQANEAAHDSHDRIEYPAHVPVPE
jgi:hypothetical protein